MGERSRDRRARPPAVSDLIEGTGVKELVEIEVDGDTITATDGHPFWVDDEGRWVDAEDLDVGDLLLLADGTTTEVDGITHHRETLTVHNLTVEGIHTHHVAIGNDAALVHNASDLCETLDPSTIRFTQDSVSPTFSDERTIGALADGLRDGSTRAADVPAIRVTEVDGQLFTLDNRRLVAFQQAGVPVSVQRVDAASIAKELERKMTTNNGGTSIMIRGGGGVWTP